MDIQFGLLARRPGPSPVGQAIGPAGSPPRRTWLASLALRDPRQTQTSIEVLALRQIHRVVAYRFGAVFGDGEIGRESPGDGADLGGLREQPGKRQRTGQDELGEAPVRVDLDRFAHALDPANHSPEIDVGKTDEKVPSEEERISRTEPYRFFDMGASFACPTEEKLHQPEISMRYREIAV